MKEAKILGVCTGQGRPQSRPPIPPPLAATNGGPFKPAAAAQRPPSAQAPKQAPSMFASGSQAKPDQAAQNHTAGPAQALSTEGQLRKQGEKSKVQGMRNHASIQCTCHWHRSCC